MRVAFSNSRGSTCRERCLELRAEAAWEKGWGGGRRGSRVSPQSHGPEATTHPTGPAVGLGHFSLLSVAGLCQRLRQEVSLEAGMSRALGKGAKGTGKRLQT